MYVYLLQIHRLHGLIHPLDHIRHTPRNLPHRNRRLHPRADGIDPRRESQQIQSLVLLPDGILRVNFGDVGMVLLYGLGRGVLSA